MLTWVIRATSSLADAWAGAWQCAACFASFQDAQMPSRQPHPRDPNFTAQQVRGATQYLDTLVSRAREQGARGLDSARTSAITSPWIWLASDSAAPNEFAEWLAEACGEVPAGTHGLAGDGPTSIRLAWIQTQSYLRGRGITSADALPAFLRAERDNIDAWMRNDSRYHGTRTQDTHTSI